MISDPQVEAATARYIDSLGPAALQKAHDYTVGKEWMILWGLLVTALVTWLIVRSRILDRVEARFGTRPRNLCAFVVAIVFSLLAETLRLQLPYGYMMVLGFLLILCVMYLPNGLASLWQRNGERRSEHG